MLTNRDLKKRILEISYNEKLSHLSSCLTAVDIIEDIYQKKKKHEKFVLSSGHAGLALYVVLEKHGIIKNAEDLLYISGIHPDRPTSMVYDPELEASTSVIDCSSGSLGHCGIGLGMALSNRLDNIYMLSSDGESNEGSFWETLRIASDLKVNNLKWYLNCNSYGAYCEIDTDSLIDRINGFKFPIEVIRTGVPEYPKWLQGLGGHYAVMESVMYEEILDAIS